jgi:hypothetical protein
MALKIETHGNSMFVVDEETQFVVAHLFLRYKVINEDGDEVALVESPEEAIAPLEAHATAHPPRWQRENATAYEKLTWYGVLRVERIDGGHWCAYRESCPLVDAGSPVTFPSHTEAQRAADAHLHDGFPSAKRTADRFTWLEAEESTDTDPTDAVGPDDMTVTGTVDGEVANLVLDSRIPPSEQDHIHNLAQAAVLEKAIGLTAINVIAAFAVAMEGTDEGRQQATDALAIHLERLVKLFKRARSEGVPFTTTVETQGKIVLRERLGGAIRNEDATLILRWPLEFLMDWARWDKERGARTH